MQLIILHGNATSNKNCEQTYRGIFGSSSWVGTTRHPWFFSEDGNNFHKKMRELEAFE